MAVPFYRITIPVSDPKDIPFVIDVAGTGKVGDQVIVALLKQNTKDFGTQLWYQQTVANNSLFAIQTSDHNCVVTVEGTAKAGSTLIISNLDKTSPENQLFRIDASNHHIVHNTSGLVLDHSNNQVSLQSSSSSPSQIWKFVQANFFSTPAYITDFQKPTSFSLWSDWISAQHQSNIALVGTTYPVLGDCQYYDESQVSARLSAADYDSYNSTKKTLAIPWNGFPKRIADGYTDAQQDEMYKAADEPQQVKTSSFLKHYMPQAKYQDKWMRVQDEYLEWFSTRDPTTHELIKVDFTCEGPEYWSKLFLLEPEVCLRLYKEYVSPQVQMDDLFHCIEGKVWYEPYNKWNTLQGAMHLTCPPNSLGAEINLACVAVVQRPKKPSADPSTLCGCAAYGVPSRNSDPAIGYQVNALAGQGLNVTCTNPVGLFIDYIKMDNWYVNGKLIDQKQIYDHAHPNDGIVRFTRGTYPGYVLRLTVEVPKTDKYGYKLSDITINGQKLKYGGQIAQGIGMNLSGTAIPCGSFGFPEVQPTVECGIPRGDTYASSSSPDTDADYRDPCGPKGILEMTDAVKSVLKSYTAGKDSHSSKKSKKKCHIKRR